MKPTDTALARFYGLPKVHKPNVPLRSIVALKCSPTYNLAKWMYSKLKFLQDNSDASVRSASQFLADLHGRRIQTDEMMVSFDVTSVFTSTSLYLARDVLRRKHDELYDKTQSSLKNEHLMGQYDSGDRNVFYFSIYAFVIVKRNMLQNFHEILNSIFPDAQFTSEEERDQQLPFLDVLFMRTFDGKIETTVYRKATNTTQ
ncbi:unnamed protein product, partial [Dibothriocephalus latus]